MAQASAPVTKARAAGLAPRNFSIGDGDGVPGGEAAIALSISRNPAPVRVGKKGVECAIMSVWTRAPRLNRMPRPRGLAEGSVSGIWGIPVELEKRSVTGVEGWLK